MKTRSVQTCTERHRDRKSKENTLEEQFTHAEDDDTIIRATNTHTVPNNSPALITIRITNQQSTQPAQNHQQKNNFTMQQQ